MRRVVTANDEEGSSFVVSDCAPPVLRFGDNSVAQLWALERDGNHWGSTDPTVGLAVETDLPPHASRWVHIEFAPGSVAEMHSTETVDLAYVLDGEISLTLDRDDVVLRRGDVLVQQGARHAWHNHGSTPCRMIVHVVSSRAVCEPDSSS